MSNPTLIKVRNPNSNASATAQLARVLKRTPTPTLMSPGYDETRNPNLDPNARSSTTAVASTIERLVSTPNLTLTEGSPTYNHSYGPITILMTP